MGSLDNRDQQSASTVDGTVVIQAKVTMIRPDFLLLQNCAWHILFQRHTCAFSGIADLLEGGEVLDEFLARSSTSNRRANSGGIP
jgi:hypothetical protein